MGVLQRFERRLEDLVQGAFARTFGGWVEPVEVAAALTREAEDKKAIVAAGRVLVPNSYIVELARADSDRLKEYDAPLRKELGDMVAEAAKEQGWSFVGPVEVLFEEVDGLSTGAFRVRSAVVAGDLPVPPREPGAGPHLLDGTRIIPLDRDVVLGRGAEADIQLTDTGISRRHARLVVGAVGTPVELSDLGSTNGTRLNGVRVRSGELQDGDRIGIGSTELIFRGGA